MTVTYHCECGAKHATYAELIACWHGKSTGYTDEAIEALEARIQHLENYIGKLLLWLDNNWEPSHKWPRDLLGWLERPKP